MTFSLIFMFFTITFSEILYRIVNRGQVECNPNFENAAQSWYSTFLAVINMLDFTQINTMVGLSNIFQTSYIIIKKNGKEESSCYTPKKHNFTVVKSNVPLSGKMSSGTSLC